MKNYYEILGVSETATTAEILQKGRKAIQEYNVDNIFAGKQIGVDYTNEEWQKANNKYAEVLEAYKTLKNELSRAEYDRKLREERRKAQSTVQNDGSIFDNPLGQATPRQRKYRSERYQSASRGFEQGTTQNTSRTTSKGTTQSSYDSFGQRTTQNGYNPYGQRQAQSGYNPYGQRQTQSGYNPYGQRQTQNGYNPYGQTQAQSGYNSYGGQGQNQDYYGGYDSYGDRESQASYRTAGSRTAQRGYATPNNKNTQRTQRYSKKHTPNDMEKGQKRIKKTGAVGKMIGSFKEVRAEEKQHPFYERHKKLNEYIREEWHQNIKNVPGEIVYQMANGTLHVTYEFIHQLKKLKYINEDSLPKYVFRNRRLAAAAVAAAIMATSGGAGNGNETIIIEQPPAITITEETPAPEEEIMDEYEIVYEEPTVQMTQYYEVVKGDTLSRISTRTGVKVYEIQEANNRVGSDKIYIGETLRLNYTIDREDLMFYTLTVPANGMTCAELAKMYRTDEETIRMLNKEAVAYINTGYTVLTDTAVVPNFITVEELDMAKEVLSGFHN